MKVTTDEHKTPTPSDLNFLSMEEREDETTRDKCKNKYILGRFGTYLENEIRVKELEAS